MKNKKNIYLIVLILIVLLIGGLFYSYLIKNKILESKIESNLTIQIKKQIDSNPTALKKVKTEEKNTEVSLIVLAKTYKVKINDKSSVYDAMNEIQNIKENNFSFKAVNYSGLGYFINEINNQEGTPGKYWTYYINDKEASVSVSKYVLENGDIISWKQK